MTDAQETKVFARSNFDLNKQVSTGSQMRQKPDKQQNALIDRGGRSEPGLNPGTNEGASDRDSRCAAADDIASDELSNAGDSCAANNAQTPQSDEEKGGVSSSASASRKFKQVRKGLAKKLQRISSNFGCELSRQSSRFGLPPAQPALSREERKNEAIMRMIERQEKQEKRREQKRLGIQVERTADDVSQDEGNGQPAARVERQSCKGRGRVSATQAKKQQSQRAANPLNKAAGGKRNSNQNPAYEISVVFQDAGAQPRSTLMSRYFYERKQYYEEKNRFDCTGGQQQHFPTTEQLHHWAMSQQHPDQMIPQGFMMGDRFRVPAGTGGNDNNTNNEDYSQSSSLSSVSKRQRLDDYRYQMLGRQQTHYMFMMQGLAAAGMNGYISQSVQPVAMSGAEIATAQQHQRCASEEQGVPSPEQSLQAAPKKLEPIKLENQASSINDAADSALQEEEKKVQGVLEATKMYQRKISMQRAASSNPALAQEQAPTKTSTPPQAVVPAIQQ